MRQRQGIQRLGGLIRFTSASRHVMSRCKCSRAGPDAYLRVLEMRVGRRVNFGDFIGGASSSARVDTKIDSCWSDIKEATDPFGEEAFRSARKNGDSKLR